MEINNPINTGDGKTVAILSYLTIVGWLIAYFGFHQGKKTSLGSYHLRQGLYLFIAYFVVYAALYVLLSITGAVFIAYLINILNVATFIMAVVGVINASNLAEKPLPFIGKKAESYFSSI